MAVWTGDEVVVWAGYVSGGAGEPTTSGAAYTPPPATVPPASATTTAPPAAPTTSEPSITTSEPPTTDVAPPEGSTIPAGAELFIGTYAGSEEYRIYSDRCPDMEHWFDAEFQLSVGTSWTLHSDYCGTVEDGIWSGEGDFTFTLDDGTKITGTFTSRAPLPTTGVPYSLTVTGGTGPYEGASGVCDLTIEIEEVDFGTQRQSGTFTCRIASDSG